MTTTIPTTSPTPHLIAPLTLGPAGTVSQVDRIAAGAPILIAWPAEDTPLRTFLAKVLAWTYDPLVTVGELYNLVYGPQNPLLEAVNDGGAIVTREAAQHPAFLLMVEAIDRKRVHVGHLDLEAARARFTVTVSEAALALGVTTSAVRQLIERGRIVARKEGSSYLIDADNLAAYRSVPRGPAPRHARAQDAGTQDPAAPATPPQVPTVRVCIGHSGRHHVRIHGARIAAPVKDGHALSGVLEPGWERLHVLAYTEDSARLFVFEPAVGGNLQWRVGDFYVTGDAVEVAHDNNAARARRTFEQVSKT